MASGGARPGSGRPFAARAKMDQKAREEAAASGMTPLEFMLSVMRDETQSTTMRLDAARAAAPFVHAKLATVENVGAGGGPIRYEVSWLD